jgi:hypothetical protein
MKHGRHGKKKQETSAFCVFRAFRGSLAVCRKPLAAARAGWDDARDVEQEDTNMNKRERQLWERAARFVTIAACIACSSCASRPQGLPQISMNQSVEKETTVHISATVDGSGRFVFTSGAVRYIHKSWSPPTDVKFNGEPWTNLDDTPWMWARISDRFDLSRARLVERQGRDTIALEHTPEGFDLYFCDAPNGAAAYAATVAIPRRAGK